LSTAAKSVREHAQQSKSQALLAVEEAAEAKSQIQNLEGATRQITSMAEVIGEIARHTNLLAINARIQAALAGDAGRGFAIVAAEVKDLAAKTRGAVEGIGGQIDQVGNATSRSTEFLLRVSARIERLEIAASGIFDSADAQCASTSDIAERVGDISVSTQSVAKNIGEAQDTASATEEMSAIILQAADLLEQRALQLQDRFPDSCCRFRKGAPRRRNLPNPSSPR
jgi:methyl-accepting chemotaxis protein